jgi:hypothetical protein
MSEKITNINEFLDGLTFDEVVIVRDLAQGRIGKLLDAPRISIWCVSDRHEYLAYFPSDGYLRAVGKLQEIAQERFRLGKGDLKLSVSIIRVNPTVYEQYAREFGWHESGADAL